MKALYFSAIYAVICGIGAAVSANQGVLNIGDRRTEKAREKRAPHWHHQAQYTGSYDQYPASHSYGRFHNHLENELNLNFSLHSPRFNSHRHSRNRHNHQFSNLPSSNRYPSLSSHRHSTYDRNDKPDFGPLYRNPDNGSPNFGSLYIPSSSEHLYPSFGPIHQSPPYYRQPDHYPYFVTNYQFPNTDPQSGSGSETNTESANYNPFPQSPYSGPRYQHPYFGSDHKFTSYIPTTESTDYQHINQFLYSGRTHQHPYYQPHHQYPSFEPHSESPSFIPTTEPTDYRPIHQFPYSGPPSKHHYEPENPYFVPPNEYPYVTPSTENQNPWDHINCDHNNNNSTKEDDFWNLFWPISYEPTERTGVEWPQWTTSKSTTPTNEDYGWGPPTTKLEIDTSESPDAWTLVVQECVESCPETTWFNPICGTNNVTYQNIEMFLCAKGCGLDIEVSRESECPIDETIINVLEETTTESIERTTEDQWSTNFMHYCMNGCKYSSEYSPICGSNLETYYNHDRLRCAQECGVDVVQMCNSPCYTRDCYEVYRDMKSTTSTTTTTPELTTFIDDWSTLVCPSCGNVEVEDVKKTTPPPINMQQCLLMCSVTNEYNPVCGTNNVTYINQESFECAKQCGVDVEIKKFSRCDVDNVPTITSTSTLPTVTPESVTKTCLKECVVPPEYDPVCGTDYVTYPNWETLECFRMCGAANTELWYRSSCFGSSDNMDNTQNSTPSSVSTTSDTTTTPDSTTTGRTATTSSTITGWATTAKPTTTNTPSYESSDDRNQEVTQPHEQTTPRKFTIDPNVLNIIFGITTPTPEVILTTEETPSTDEASTKVDAQANKATTYVEDVPTTTEEVFLIDPRFSSV